MMCCYRLSRLKESRPVFRPVLGHGLRLPWTNFSGEKARIVAVSGLVLGFWVGIGLSPSLFRVV